MSRSPIHCTCAGTRGPDPLVSEDRGGVVSSASEMEGCRWAWLTREGRDGESVLDADAS